jgi:hypothetical protein
VSGCSPARCQPADLSLAEIDGDFQTRVSAWGRNSLLMSRPRKYPQELLDQRGRLALEFDRPIAHVAKDAGVPSGTLRKGVRQAEADQGVRPDLPIGEIGRRSRSCGARSSVGGPGAPQSVTQPLSGRRIACGATSPRASQAAYGAVISPTYGLGRERSTSTLLSTSSPPRGRLTARRKHAHRACLGCTAVSRPASDSRALICHSHTTTDTHPWTTGRPDGYATNREVANIVVQ